MVRNLPDHVFAPRQFQDERIHQSSIDTHLRRPGVGPLKRHPRHEFPGQVNVAGAFPDNENEIIEILDFAAKKNIIIIPYGGGTSVVGHLTVPEDDRPVITLSMKNMDRLLSLNGESRLAVFDSRVPTAGIRLRRYSTSVLVVL